jgi:hypothetical protein
MDHDKDDDLEDETEEDGDTVELSMEDLLPNVDMADIERIVAERKAAAAQRPTVAHRLQSEAEVDALLSAMDPVVAETIRIVARAYVQNPSAFRNPDLQNQFIRDAAALSLRTVAPPPGGPSMLDLLLFLSDNECDILRVGNEIITFRQKFRG